MTLHPPGVPHRIARWEGMLVRRPSEPEVYLVLDYLRRHLPSPTVFNNLFDPRYNELVHIGTEFDADEVPFGSPLSIDARLAQESGGPKIFLVNDQVIRWITTPEVMRRYNFSFQKAEHVVVPNLPRGPDIVEPTCPKWPNA